MKYNISSCMTMVLLLILSTSINGKESKPDERQCSLLPVFKDFYDKLTSANKIGDAFIYLDPRPGLKISTSSRPEVETIRLMLSLALTTARVEQFFGYNERCYLKDGNKFGELKLKVKYKKPIEDGADRLSIWFLNTDNTWRITNYGSWNSRYDKDDITVKYIELEKS